MPSQRRRENPLVEIARARVLHARPWPQSQLLRHCWHFRSTQNSLSLPGAPSAQEEFEPVGHPEPGTLFASTKDVDLVSKHCVLDDQIAPGAAHVDSHAHDLAARGEWAQAIPDPLGGVSNPTCDLREEE